MIGDRAKQGQRRRDVLLSIKRLDGRVVRMIPVHEVGVAFGNVRRIHQHGLRQIDRGRRGINGTAESVLYQQWQPPAVIDVRVRKKYGIDGPGVE